MQVKFSQLSQKRWPTAAHCAQSLGKSADSSSVEDPSPLLQIRLDLPATLHHTASTDWKQAVSSATASGRGIWQNHFFKNQIFHAQKQRKYLFFDKLWDICEAGAFFLIFFQNTAWQTGGNGIYYVTVTRRDSQEVRQRSAKSLRSVRFRFTPPFFVKNTTCGGALWAISWQISGLIFSRGRKSTPSDSPWFTCDLASHCIHRLQSNRFIVWQITPLEVYFNTVKWILQVIT